MANPTLVTRLSDYDTGIGRVDDELVLVAGGVEVMRMPTNHSYLTVRRDSVLSPLIGLNGFSVWRRFARGYQIPRVRPDASYVDLTMTVSPRQDAEEYKGVIQVAYYSRKLTNSELQELIS